MSGNNKVVNNCKQIARFISVGSTVETHKTDY